MDRFDTARALVLAAAFLCVGVPAVRECDGGMYLRLRWRKKTLQKENREM